MNEYKHLSYASSLCGNCTEVCAVKINLHELLLENRNEAVQTGAVSFGKICMENGKRASLSRGTSDEHGQFGKRKTWMVNKIFKAGKNTEAN